MSSRPGLLIVDDHPLYVEGLTALLARSPLRLRCAWACSADAMLEQLRGGDSPSIVIVSHVLGRSRAGLALLQRIGADRPRLARALLAEADDPVLCQQARRAGISGCLSRRMAPAAWLEALETLLAGGRYFFAAPSAAAPLSERQISVLQLASSGLANRQIAQRLHLTERTVKYHLSETYQRLASSTRTEAVAKATALGLISLPGH